MEANKPIAILGAGLAGLTAAHLLRQKRIPFVLFEAGTKIAGLASSFSDKEGFTHDFGAHFITNRLAKAIGVEPDCYVVKHYGEVVWLNGRYYAYPFGLVTVPRMSFSFLQARIGSLQMKGPASSATEWFRRRYGKILADTIALPLVEAWSGVPADQLSPAVGASLPASIAKSFYLKMASHITGRAVACGYNRERPEKPSVWHVYPKGGVATLCNKLAEGIEDSIQLQTPVEEIYVEDDHVVAVKAGGQTHEVSAVISTAPANILAKMVKGTQLLEGVKPFRFRPMVFVNLRVEGRNLLPDTVVWFPEKNYPFFRLTDVTRSMPWMAPEGKSIITADLGCQKEDELWSMSDDNLTALCIRHLKPLIPDIEKKIVGSTVLRTPFAYPVFLSEYESERQAFERSTNIDNLLSIGRNGEFSHRFMEDVYWRTRDKVDALVASLWPSVEDSPDNHLVPATHFA